MLGTGRASLGRKRVGAAAREGEQGPIPDGVRPFSSLINYAFQ